ncbi:MAG: OmpH family outer membrane protein [Nitrospirae bacterium]|nr:OmpH family outer membrane protein [Nitrospirota bacterium]
MNTTIKSIGISGLAALLIFGMEALAHGADKIGYINPQRIISESNIGKKKTEEYNRLREQKDKELRGKLAEIEALNNDLKKGREQKTINERKVKDLIEQIQNKNKEIERYAADVKEDLAKKDVESVNEILLKAAPILNDIGSKRGYAVILKNIQDIAYIGAGVDITGEVIKRLNETK